MRHAIRATAAVITLACTGGAMAQWCDGTNGWTYNWCGMVTYHQDIRYEYSRALDKCYVNYRLRYTNLRGCHGEVIDDVLSAPQRHEMLQWQSNRPCIGYTEIRWYSPWSCALEAGCGGNPYYRNVWGGCPEVAGLPVYWAPPSPPGNFRWTASPCPNDPERRRAVLVTQSRFSPYYSIKVRRTVVASRGEGAEVPGSSTEFTLGPDGYALVGPCAGTSTVFYRIVEYCAPLQPYQKFELLVTEGLGGVIDAPTGVSYTNIRNLVSTRLSSRGSHNVRTPTAVIGRRGFAAAETVLEGYAEDPTLQIRWQRILDAAEPENGIVPVELLEDGPLVGGSSVTGTHGPVLRLTGFTEHDAGTYLMRVIPAGGTINDAEIVTSIRVVDDVGQPFFTEEPRARTVCPSQISLDTPISFTAPAVATTNDPDDPIVYQWYVNGEMVAPSPGAWNSSGDRIWLSDPYGWGLGSTSGPRLDIFRFALGKGADIHNVVFWLECEAMNSHGSSRTRPIPFVIDIDTDDCDGNGTTDACEIAAGAADANADGIPDACQCLADINGDGMADGADLGQLLSQWGPVQPNATSDRCDLNADGRIDGADLGVMLSGWGSCGG
jgi:hypothetical protein